MLGTISGITSKNSNRGDPKSRGMLYAYVDKMRIDFCRRQMAAGPGCLDIDNGDSESWTLVPSLPVVALQGGEGKSTIIIDDILTQLLD